MTNDELNLNLLDFHSNNQYIERARISEQEKKPNVIDYIYYSPEERRRYHERRKKEIQDKQMKKTTEEEKEEESEALEERSENEGNVFLGRKREREISAQVLEALKEKLKNKENVLLGRKKIGETPAEELEEAKRELPGSTESFKKEKENEKGELKVIPIFDFSKTILLDEFEDEFGWNTTLENEQ